MPFFITIGPGLWQPLRDIDHMEVTRMDTIGFIGLGRMGRPMASNLSRKGFRLHVYDIDPDAAAELELLQASGAANVAEVAVKSDVIVTMLPDSAVVGSVVAGAEGVLANARAGSLILDMSTIDPNTTDRLAREAAAKGIGFVDAPVGRLASHADRGESLFMVGASEADFQRVKPLLEAMGTTIHHCGGVGAGTRTKLVNNYLAVSSCQLNAEALALSQRFGLDLERTLDVLYGTTAVNGQLKIAWPAKVLKGDTAPGFTIDLAHKDLTLVVEAANAAKVPMPIAAAAREAYSTARSRGFGGLDFSAMVDVLCDLAGIGKPRLPD
jgi:4-hydroxybutyrate dehydrogenase/sulfolactaldehyde 3-reductase